MEKQKVIFQEKNQEKVLMQQLDQEYIKKQKKNNKKLNINFKKIKS